MANGEPFGGVDGLRGDAVDLALAIVVALQRKTLTLSTVPLTVTLFKTTKGHGLASDILTVDGTVPLQAVGVPQFDDTQLADMSPFPSAKCKQLGLIVASQVVDSQI